jgi:hypothetical protein
VWSKNRQRRQVKKRRAKKMGWKTRPFVSNTRRAALAKDEPRLKFSQRFKKGASKAANPGFYPEEAAGSRHPP